MKKKAAILILGACAAAMLAGCDEKLDVNKNTIALQRGGKVLEAAVEDFSQEYYDAEELESYIQKTVDDYTADHGKNSVSVTESRVEDKKAYLTLKYEDVEIFSDFTGIECFSGSIVQAQTEGYAFDTDFYAVEDGAVSKETVSADEVLKEDDLKVFIVKENSDIVVPGKVVYVSAQGTGVSAKDTVTVEPKENDTDESILVYVLYK